MISDHFPIIHHCNNSKKNPKPTIVKTRNFSDENIGRFNQALHNLDWSAVTDCADTQTAYNCFSDLFLSLYEIYFPLTEKNLIQTSQKSNLGSVKVSWFHAKPNLNWARQPLTFLLLKTSLLLKLTATYTIELWELVKKCTFKMNLHLTNLILKEPGN